MFDLKSFQTPKSLKLGATGSQTHWTTPSVFATLQTLTNRTLAVSGFLVELRDGLLGFQPFWLLLEHQNEDSKSHPQTSRLFYFPERAGANLRRITPRIYDRKGLRPSRNISWKYYIFKKFTPEIQYTRSDMNEILTSIGRHPNFQMTLTLTHAIKN